MLARMAIALMMILSMASLVAAQDAPTADEICDAAQPMPLARMQFESAESVLDDGADYFAVFCTSAGAILVDLYEAQTPMTVNNFIFLAGQGYYDSTTFHRVIPNFMAQGGDPTGTGRGGPGYQFGDEPVGWLVFDRPGLLAMANAGAGTNGSQFFITTAPTPHLNYKHTIFGEVLQGQDVVVAIRERDPSTATEAGETLRTALILDDADAVASDIPDMPPASQDDVVAAFEAFRDAMPPNLPHDEATSGLFDAQSISEGLDDEGRANFLAFAAAHGHEFRYRLDIVNAGCEQAIYFSSLGYQLDTYASADDAANAIVDEFNSAQLLDQGYQTAGAGIFIREAGTCAGDAGWQVLEQYRVGRYIAALDVTLPQGLLEEAGITPAALTANLRLQVEPGFADIFRAELR